VCVCVCVCVCVLEWYVFSPLLGVWRQLNDVTRDNQLQIGDDSILTSIVLCARAHVCMCVYVCVLVRGSGALTS
jgi:hypothetical protein